jgi:hypothetical protein
VCEQRKHGSVGAGAGNRPGYPICWRGAPSAASVALDELPPEVRDRLSDEPVDELLAGARTEEKIVGPGGLLADIELFLHELR